MKLIVGLGNPGEKYEGTRHNIGFAAVERLQNTYQGGEWKVESKFQAEVSKLLTMDVILIKPLTFMNESGISVSKIASFYKVKPDDIYVIHDDLDIKLGEFKIQKGIGPRLHYGISSIDGKLGDTNYWRIRLGVDGRGIENRTPGDRYVLQKFNNNEKETADKTIGKLLIELVKLISN